MITIVSVTANRLSMRKITNELTHAIITMSLLKKLHFFLIAVVLNFLSVNPLTDIVGNTSIFCEYSFKNKAKMLAFRILFQAP